MRNLRIVVFSAFAIAAQAEQENAASAPPPAAESTGKDAHRTVMPAEVLASTNEIYQRLAGAAAAAAAVEKAAKDADAVRDGLQAQMSSMMGPWCAMAKIEPKDCSVDLKTGVVTDTKAKAGVAPEKGAPAK